MYQEDEEVMRRNLDGTFFRIGKENICFSDLSEFEQDAVLEDRSIEWLKNLCKHLASVIKEIGDQFDIYMRTGDEEDA